MQKKMAGVIILLVTLFFASAVWASPWGIVANCGSGTTNSTIQTIDLGTTPGTVYGPFLSGTSVTGLGGSGGLYEVAVVPGGHYALVSNFGDSIVYRVDISNLTNPVLTDFIEIGFFAEDIAISPNGQFAVVSDGGFSDNLAFINLSTFTSSGTTTLTDGQAQAVAIGPDNQTVIMCDYFNSQIVYGTVNAGLTGLVSGTTLTTSGVSNPVNVEIGLDGTVLVADNASSSVSVFRITAPGIVVAGATPTIAGLPGKPQSIAISPDGTKAYVVTGSETSYDQLSWLQINGPGNVTLGGAGVATLLANSGTAALFGVDTLAVAPDGSFALASNTNASGVTPSYNISRIDLNTFAVSTITTNSPAIPTGIAIWGEGGRPPVSGGGGGCFIATAVYGFYRDLQVMAFGVRYPIGILLLIGCGLFMMIYIRKRKTV